MPLIGMIGENAKETAQIFLDICQAGGYRATPMREDLAENGEAVYIDCPDAAGMARVIIAQDASAPLAKAVAQLTPEDYLLVNGDNHDIFPSLAHNTARLITFGFNGRASVTASSVTAQAMQVCIQRGFFSLNGHPYEPQEFSAPNNDGADVGAVLGAVTACAVCDISV